MESFSLVDREWKFVGQNVASRSTLGRMLEMDFQARSIKEETVRENMLSGEPSAELVISRSLL